MPDIEITSVGSVCFNRWRVCGRTGLPYLTSPFDNIENKSQWQFDNIVEMLHEDFRQIRKEDLEDRNHESTDIATGEKRTFIGYTYVGNRLLRPLVLPHFLDGVADEKEGWERWRHKCTAFQEALEDTARKLLLVSLRLNSDIYTDDEERRRYLVRSASTAMNWMRRVYGRSDDNLRLLSIVVADDIDRTQTMYDSPMFRQVLVPSGDEAGVPYWKRKERQEYVDIANAYIEEFNKEHTIKETLL